MLLQLQATLVRRSRPAPAASTWPNPKLRFRIFKPALPRSAMRSCQHASVPTMKTWSRWETTSLIRQSKFTTGCRQPAPLLTSTRHQREAASYEPMAFSVPLNQYRARSGGAAIFVRQRFLLHRPTAYGDHPLAASTGGGGENVVTALVIGAEGCQKKKSGAGCASLESSVRRWAALRLSAFLPLTAIPCSLRMMTQP